MDKSRAVLFEEMYRSGKTLDEIGRLHGITRERVRQILKKHGVTRNDRCKITKAEILAKERLVRFMKTYGCHPDLVKDVNAKERINFRMQRRNAYARGIEFKLTLYEWISIWRESGHYQDRGRGSGGYVMARCGDIGPYEVGNVYICSQRQNMLDSYVFKPWHTRNHRKTDKTTQA